ncbi:hypothetical protein BASA81_006411 [Batrachochytrium salamandrivorans]|nr:hypothetical protein BASA81_006411 [Batrachochytrium salamandrivorans]
MLRRVMSTAATTTKSTPRRESTFVKIWIKRSAAAWPIIGISAIMVAFSATFVVHMLRGPEIHFNKQERATIDYVANSRSEAPAKAWGESAFHSGPSIFRPSKRVFDREY